MVKVTDYSKLFVEGTKPITEKHITRDRELFINTTQARIKNQPYSIR